MIKMFSCAGCQTSINDRFLLAALDLKWHVKCLRCSLCFQSLDGENSCYCKEGKVYCKFDYFKLFGPSQSHTLANSRNCTRCQLTIFPNELVMRVHGNVVYHLHCFTCSTCMIPLNPGDQFGMADGRLFCKTHHNQYHFYSQPPKDSIDHRAGDLKDSNFTSPFQAYDLECPDQSSKEKANVHFDHQNRESNQDFKKSDDITSFTGLLEGNSSPIHARDDPVAGSSKDKPSTTTTVRVNSAKYRNKKRKGSASVGENGTCSVVKDKGNATNKGTVNNSDNAPNGNEEKFGSVKEKSETIPETRNIETLSNVETGDNSLQLPILSHLVSSNLVINKIERRCSPHPALQCHPFYTNDRRPEVEGMIDQRFLVETNRIDQRPIHQSTDTNKYINPLPNPHPSNNHSGLGISRTNSSVALEHKLDNSNLMYHDLDRTTLSPEPEQFLMNSSSSTHPKYYGGSLANLGADDQENNVPGMAFLNIISNNNNIANNSSNNKNVNETDHHYPDVQNNFYPNPLMTTLQHPGHMGHHHHHHHHIRNKRLRTSFKHYQLKTMKTYFALNHNPDAKDLKQLSQKTGLSKRVLQVWFQNARAKYRRNASKQESGGIGTAYNGSGACSSLGDEAEDDNVDEDSNNNNSNPHHNQTGILMLDEVCEDYGMIVGSGRSFGSSGSAPIPPYQCQAQSPMASEDSTDDKSSIYPFEPTQQPQQALSPPRYYGRMLDEH